MYLFGVNCGVLLGLCKCKSLSSQLQVFLITKGLAMCCILPVVFVCMLVFKLHIWWFQTRATGAILSHLLVNDIFKLISYQTFQIQCCTKYSWKKLALKNYALTKKNRIQSLGSQIDYMCYFPTLSSSTPHKGCCMLRG